MKENISRVPSIFWCDGIVLHSYASISILSILIARLLGKRVIIFHWDVYPTTLRGVRRSGAVRRLADVFETLAVRMATTVVIPSNDFNHFVTHRNLVVQPIWPSIASSISTISPAVAPLKIAFVGQLDISRGVETFLDWFSVNINAPVEMHLFSGNQRLLKCYDEKPNIQLKYHPRMEREKVQAILAQMHFGLVSLNKDLDQPGFPSKVFDYILANVPVIYYGRPLPDFCALLRDTGVGDVIDDNNKELFEIHDRLASDWEMSKNRFLGRTAMHADRFLELL